MKAAIIATVLVGVALSAPQSASLFGRFNQPTQRPGFYNPFRQQQQQQQGQYNAFNRPSYTPNTYYSPYSVNRVNSDSSGQYRPDNSGAYNSQDGQYHPDASGSYNPDGAGGYVHSDDPYRHKDGDIVGYKGDQGNNGGNGGSGSGFGGSGGSGGFGSGDRYNGGSQSNNGFGTGNRYPQISPSAGFASGSGNNRYPQIATTGTGSVYPQVTGVGNQGGATFGSVSPIPVPSGLRQGNAAGLYDNRNYGIIRKVEKVEQDGYHYLYETENGILGEEEGHLEHKGTEQEAMQAKGFFEYTGPDSIVYHVDYTADEDGFHPNGAHLPQPPAIPEAIVRSLEYQKAKGLL